MPTKHKTTTNRIRKKDGRLESYYHELFEALPLPAFVLSSDMTVTDFNREGFHFMTQDASDTFSELLFGSAIGCNPAVTSNLPCGFTPACRNCKLLEAVHHTNVTSETVKTEVSLDLVSNGKPSKQQFLLATAPLNISPHPSTLIVLQQTAAQQATPKALAFTAS